MVYVEERVPNATEVPASPLQTVPAVKLSGTPVSALRGDAQGKRRFGTPVKASALNVEAAAAAAAASPGGVALGEKRKVPEGPTTRAKRARESSASGAETACKKALSNLRSLESEWQERVDAMATLRQLVAEHGRSNAVVDVLVKNKKCLTLQCSDVRSRIVQEACATVEQVLVQCASHAKGLVSPCVEALLRVCMNTIGPIRKAGEDAVRNLSKLDSKVGLAVLDEVLHHTNHEHASVRAMVLEGVAAALTVDRARDDFTSRGDKIVAALEKGAMDSAAKVRDVAKQAFPPCQAALGDRCLAGLSESARRRLESRSSLVPSKKNGTGKKPAVKKRPSLADFRAQMLAQQAEHQAKQQAE